MAVPTTITDLSTTANSNSPAGSEVPSSGNGPDEYIRALGSIVRVLRAKGSDVASATTTDLGAATNGDFVHVTGTTTITGLGTVAAGIKKVVTFDGALTLTHNGTSLILPGAANITTAAGDCAEFISEGSGNWRCTGYTFAGGQGNVTGAASSVDNEIALFSGTGGKTIKRASTTGILKGASGVLSAASAGTDYVAPGAYTGSGLTMATARLLGRTTASTGAAEEISVGTGLTLSAGTLTASSGAVIHLRDVQAANTAGGTFTSGAWQTRVLNTEATDTGNNCTLSSNQFTLAAGTYNINARAPAQAVGQHKAKLRNITDGTDTIIGSSCQAPAAVASQTDSIVQGQFTIATSKTFELQHQANTTRSTDGFGLASNFGVSEIYAEVWLEKVA